MTSSSDETQRARKLRKRKTVSEGLLWSVLRAKQLCGLKFRQQHLISPWIVDFACPQEMLVVEIDGEYHDQVVESDIARQRRIEALGWKVLRFSAEEVEADAEAVARAIASKLNRPYEFKRRKATGSGLKHITAPGKQGRGR